MRIFFNCFSLMMGAAILVGCSSGQPPGADYLPRLLNVLDEEQPGEPGVRPIARLSRTALTLTLPESRIDLLDMLSLGQCQLGRIIGERNSSLGKLAKHSQRMKMERDFLIQAPVCIAQLRDEQTDLANTIQAAWDNKYEHRMSIWWNGWIAGDEWRALTSASAKPLEMIEVDGYPGAEAHQALTLQALDLAIRQGENWRNGALDYSSEQQENALHQWLLGESIGRWQTTQSWLTNQLTMSTKAINHRREYKHPCPSGVKTQRADYLHNVMMKFYIAELQPYMTMSDRFGAELIERLEKLQTLAPAPAAYRNWLVEVQQSREQFLQVSKAHVNALSTVLDECGMSPAG